jgi:PAS domain S-box-containing protein
MLAALVASTFIVLLYLMLQRHFRLRETLLSREHRARAQAESALAEQNRAQAELVTKEAETRRLSKMNEAVVVNMREGLYTVDERGLVTFMNPAAERLLGWTSAELQGRKMHDAIHFKHADGTPFPAEECAGLRVLSDGAPLTNHEDVFVRKDGTCFPVIHSAARIVLGEEVRGLVVVFQDITNRKKLEAEHDALLATAERAREAAENANRAKDSFLATISHELRTPLSPILTWTSLLQRESLDPSQVRQGLDAIRRCARAQAQLIEDLLDVSRIVSGKMRIEVRPVDLVGVIEAAVEVVRPAADAKQVRLQVVLDTKAPPVSGDPQRLQQVVWNLLSNAIKFTPKGGHATVTLERVNSQVEIAVSDTGQGMDGEFLPHVFDRFQQADTSSTRLHMGLGLGLAIVRHIIEAHGGTVHAESPGVDRGSVFTVKLPLVLIQRSAGEALRRHPTMVPFTADDFPALNGLRVLVVDDEPDSNEVLRTLFSSCGADVRVADSVARALEVMDGWNPGVLISDIGMPGEDGYSLIAKVRARENGGLPVIALTAFASTEDRVRLLSAGFTTHLPKPVEPAELLAVVASVATK